MPVMSDERKRPKRPYRSTRRANGPMLRYWREEADLSQIELGKRAGISHTQISRIETGESESPRTSTLKALASALDKDLEDLVIREQPAPYGVPEKPGPTPGQQEAFRRIEEEKNERDFGSEAGTEDENGGPGDPTDRAP